MKDQIISIDTSRKGKNIEVVYEPYDVLLEGSPELKQKAKEVDFNDSSLDFLEISGKLKATAKYYKAYGVAATQCGLPLRCFVIGYGDDYMCFFNPEIIQSSEKTIFMEEMCLSFPLMVVGISRPTEISIKYQDEKGKEIVTFLTGISARVFQHELDHLDGICFLERAKPLALKNSKRKRDKFISRIEKQKKLLSKANKR